MLSDREKMLIAIDAITQAPTSGNKVEFLNKFREAFFPSISFDDLVELIEDYLKTCKDLSDIMESIYTKKFNTRVDL